VSDLINNPLNKMKGKERSIPSYTPKKYLDLVQRENQNLKHTEKATEHLNTDKDLKAEKRRLLEEKRKLRENNEGTALEEKTKEIDDKLQKLKTMESTSPRVPISQTSESSPQDEEKKLKEEKRKKLEEKRKMRSESTIKGPSSSMADDESIQVISQIEKEETKPEMKEEIKPVEVVTVEDSKTKEEEEVKKKAMKEELKRQADEELNKEEKTNKILSISKKERIEKKIPEIDKEEEKVADELFKEANLEFKQQRNYSNAVQLYSKAIKHNAYLIQAYFNRGIVYYNTKDYEKSIRDMTMVIDYQSKNTRAFYIRFENI
jgi:tetratricopeptide (TPR) repeat protein